MTERFHPVWQGLIAAGALGVLVILFGPAVSATNPRLAATLGFVLAAICIRGVVRLTNDVARRRPVTPPTSNPDSTSKSN